MGNKLDIITLPVGNLQTNCYLVKNKESDESVIIDPGDDGEYIEGVISDKKIRAMAIIATHGHFDHILAASALKLAYNIPFLAHKKDKFLIDAMQSSAQYFLGIKVDPPPSVDSYFKDGSDFRLGESKMHILSTPGHTPGSICLYIKSNNVLFCGDLMFDKGSLGRSDFSYSDTTLLQKSLRKILALPPRTVIYPGHGPAFTVGEERDYIAKSHFLDGMAPPILA